MTPPPAENLAARVFLGPTLRAQPDRRLVDLVRDGYDAAFEEIVRRYRRQLDRFAAAIVGGRSEDVTQDAFSKALPALRRSEAEIELRPWLYRIVRNTALNELRDRGPVTAELPETMTGGRGPAAEVEAREELRDLIGRLRALPEPQRAALVMRELEGLSHEEIAAALGVSGGAARQAIYRARAALRDGLGLLVPMPLLRALVEHGDEAARAGGALAGAGASSAGGAVLGGLGGSALKVGMATVLIAGTVGAGVAIEHRQGERPGAEAAEAAPLVGGPGSGLRRVIGGDSRNDPSSGSGRGSGGEDHSQGGDRGENRSGDGGGSLDDLGRSGSDSGSDDSSGHSGSGSGHGGPRPSSDPGSGSGSGDGGDDGIDDHSGPGSGGGVDDSSGSSGGSGDDGGLSGGSGGSGSGGGETGGSSGPGGEVEGEPVPAPAPVDGGGSGSGSGGESSGSGSSGSGGGDDFGATTSGLDVSP